jgi:hypothetical protein
LIPALRKEARKEGRKGKKEGEREGKRNPSSYLFIFAPHLHYHPLNCTNLISMFELLFRGSHIMASHIVTHTIMPFSSMMDNIYNSGPLRLQQS